MTLQPQSLSPVEPLRIANCCGFYGDRISAAKEMVDGGPIDVLTGDWLAELTMLILAKGQMKDADLGFATTFLTQMEQVLGTCLDRGIAVVTNAGGLNPAGCAEALELLAKRLGLAPKIAHIEGDNLMSRLGELTDNGVELHNIDTGESLDTLDITPIAANAYLGGWGIATALDQGADVVIAGRVTDAAVVLGPAASHFGWDRNAWDHIAGAVVAGHIIECGTQCTGGNYAFFNEVPGLERLGFPIAEINPDGSFVVTKHPGSGGLVSTGTVTAQLLYEIQGLGYYNPDVVVAFDSIEVVQQGPDRVLVSGIVGLPAPATTKVAINYQGGFRNSMTFMLTGLDIDAKAKLAERTLWSLVPGGRESFDSVDVRLRRGDHENPATNDDALAELQITVTDRDKAKVGRAFSNKVIEMVLASYPGLFTTSPPGDASSFGVYWPALIADDFPNHEVVNGDVRTRIHPVPMSDRTFSNPEDGNRYALTGFNRPSQLDSMVVSHRWPIELDELRRQTEPKDEPVAAAPLGIIFGARSGDKGGNANIGVWARSDEAYIWLHKFLTVDRLTALVKPEVGDLRVERYELPNIRSLNFVIVGLLGRGVAASMRTDPQAKGLGEYLRAKVVMIPTRLLDR
ncbi:MAG: acyclic terpene utilization AtuA family protein [Actinomycetes bacterium]